MKKILVIEDNQELRENTAEILEMAGYDVITAEDGRKGVNLAVNDKPALIVCDIMMPELDGYGVLHMLRRNKETQHIPFIFLTAKTERGDFRKGMEMGADDYLNKPFEEIELLKAIEVRIQKQELMHQHYPATQKGLSRFVKDIKDTGMLQQLSDQYPVESYERKQSLYSEGKHPRYLYILLNGKVKSYQLHEDGKEYITDLFNEGDFIGYTAIFEEKPYDDSAVVVEDASVIKIPRDEFLQMVYSDINIAAKFIQIITQNVKEKESRLLNLAYSSLRKRIAKALVDIHEKFNKQQTGALIEFTREEIAQYVGTATESLIRTLSDFKAEKLIEIKGGKISLLNIEKLKNLIY